MARAHDDLLAVPCQARCRGNAQSLCFMLDSGATNNFMSLHHASALDVKLTPRPIGKVRLADNKTVSIVGVIDVELCIG